MTTEETIKMLEYIKRTGNGESEYKNDAQAIAIDMAIKALEEVERYKKVIKEFYARLDYDCGLKGLDDYDYCSGLIHAKRILERQLEGVSE